MVGEHKLTYQTGSTGVRESQGRTITTSTVVKELKNCSKRRDLQRGRLLHSHAVECGCDKNIYVANTLISMYCKCGSMQSARDVLDNMKQRTVVSWTTLIHGYVENEQSSMALDMFNRMDCTPDCVTFVAVLKACAELAAGSAVEKKICLQKGRAFHRQARGLGYERNVFVASTLVDMYSKCGDMLQARDVFDGMVHRDVVTWSALVLGYVENGESLAALDLFNAMDCAPNHITFSAALKACAGFDKEMRLQKGMSIHRYARELGYEKDVYVGSALVDMYCKCGDMPHARGVFNGMVRRDVVSWNALILGYVENGECSVALDMFVSMDCAPDNVTFVGALKASGNKEICRCIHRQATVFGFEKDVYVASTLVDMYSKLGDMVHAREVFDGMVHRSIVSWNALILGYVDNAESSVALDVFNMMDCTPNHVTFVAALKACASLGALRCGQRIHDRVCGLGLERDETVATCLVDFYGRCGKMDAAEEVFNRVDTRGVACWTALIGGYSSRGDVSQVHRTVKRMQESGVKPDGITFLLLLTACNHAGSVEEGHRYFKSIAKHGISPTVEHYSCMVDMLGRSNRLQDALSLVRSMPFEANSVTWTALLGACRQWSNVVIGEVAFSAVLSLNEDKECVATAYVLMQDIYERLGMAEQIETKGNMLVENT